jgi:integrative and conjugative element protein (TIGR02256 family)
VTVWVSNLARTAMLTEARSRRGVETGGGLFGFASDAAIVITQVTVAGGTTTRTMLSFTPDHRDLQEQINRVIDETEGRVCLIGEWHTHPWGVPHLSPTDEMSVRRTADQPGAGIARPVAIVIAPTGVPRARMRVGAFVWDPKSRKPIKQPVRSWPSDSVAATPKST